MLGSPSNAPPGPPQKAGYDAAYYKHVRERFTECEARERANRDRGIEDAKFAANEQWAQADLAQRKKDKRLALTDNRVRQPIKQITGEIRRNRPAIKCSPGDGLADVATAEIYDGIIRSIERASNASKVYARAADQAATSGQGHFRLTLVYADDDGFDLEPRIEPIRNPFSVIWDTQSVHDDRSDARFCFVHTEIPRDEFERRFPNATQAPWYVSRPQSIQRDQHVFAGGGVTVCEYWCVKEVPALLVEVIHDRTWFDEFGAPQPPTGAVTKLYDPDQTLLTEIAQQGWRISRQRQTSRKRIEMHLLGGGEHPLQDVYVWPGQRIPIFTALGEEIDVGDVVVRHGLISFSKDNQRLRNFTLTTMAEYAALAPKVPWLVAEESIAGYEDEWALANTSPKSHLRFRAYDEDGRQLPQPKRPDPISTNPGLSELSAVAVDGMKANTGVYDASLGNRSNETSGVAIQARDAQADTGTFVYIDNLSTAIEACGRELVTLIPLLYSARKQIRILGKDDAPAIIALEAQGIDLSRGRYDVIVKTGPAYESRRKELRDQIVELMRGGAPPQFAALLITELMRLSDADNAEELASELRAVAEATGLLPPPPGTMPGGPSMPGMQPPPGAMPHGAPPAPGGAQFPPGMIPPGIPMSPNAGPRGPMPMRGPGPDVFAPASPRGVPGPSARVRPRLPVAGPPGMTGAI